MNKVFGLRSILRTWAKPARDEAYRKWIKTRWCLACGRNWNIDPAHTGPHGPSQKASDYNCIPLCRECHQAYDKSPLAFAINRGWDLPVILAYFHHCYEQQTGRKVGPGQDKEGGMSFWEFMILVLFVVVCAIVAFLDLFIDRTDRRIRELEEWKRGHDG